MKDLFFNHLSIIFLLPFSKVASKCSLCTCFKPVCTFCCVIYFTGKSKPINPVTRQLFKVKKQSVTTPEKEPSLDNLVDTFYTVLCKSNASEFRRISWLFMAFRRNFPPNKISATFPQTFKAPIVLILAHFRTIIHGGR